MGTIKTHIDSTVSMSLSLLLFWFFILCETFQSTMSFYPYFSILPKFCFPLFWAGRKMYCKLYEGAKNIAHFHLYF